MNDEELNSTWFLNLIMANNKLTAVTMHTARCVGITPQRYNEIGYKLGEILESTSGPQEFWSTIGERSRALYLNDAESIVFGSFLCNVLTQISNSVLWGKKLAKANKVDYQKLRRNALIERGKCLGLTDGELEL